MQIYSTSKLDTMPMFAYKKQTMKKAPGNPFNSFADFASGLTVEMYHVDIAVIFSVQLCTKWYICIYMWSQIQGISSTKEPSILPWTEEDEQEQR